MIDIYSNAIVRDPIRSLFLTILALPAIPIAFILFFAIYLPSKSIYRFIRVNLGLDRYSHVPSVTHSSKWSFLVGDFLEIRNHPPGHAILKWMKQLDSQVFIYRGLFYEPRIIMADPVAMNFVLGSAQAYNFVKSQETRNILADLLGDGLLTAEGSVHKLQRKLLQPAFSMTAIKNLQPIFFKHALILSKHLVNLVEKTQGPSSQPFILGQSMQCSEISEKRKPAIDMSFWIGRTALDVIGDCGFATDFSSIDSAQETQGDTMAGAFSSMLAAIFNSGALYQVQQSLASLTYPGFGLVRYLPTSGRKEMDKTKAMNKKICQSIIDEKRRALLQELGMDPNEKQNAKGLTKAQLETSSPTGKDLLYLLMRANMANDIPENERLSDEDLRFNSMTIFMAGYETTSTLLSWTIWMLAKHPDIQEKLRLELQEVFAGREEIGYDELNDPNSLKFLDHVMKEMLRFISPVAQTDRKPIKDVVVPLSKPYKSKDGKSTFDHVVLKKVQEFHIPIQLLHFNKDIWGQDAEEFNPERWNELPERAKKTGFPNNVLAFLEGPRGCIGSRFAMAEYKTILSCLLLNLRFESIPGWEIESKEAIVVRGRIKGQEDLGLQIPVKVSKV